MVYRRVQSHSFGSKHHAGCVVIRY